STANVSPALVTVTVAGASRASRISTFGRVLLRAIVRGNGDALSQRHRSQERMVTSPGKVTTRDLKLGCRSEARGNSAFLRNYPKLPRSVEWCSDRIGEVARRRSARKRPWGLPEGDQRTVAFGAWKDSGRSARSGGRSRRVLQIS